jgi:hypothetical protein
VISGAKDIEEFLIANDFILNPYHRDSSAWE